MTLPVFHIAWSATLWRWLKGDGYVGDDVDGDVADASDVAGVSYWCWAWVPSPSKRFRRRASAGLCPILPEMAPPLAV